MEPGWRVWTQWFRDRRSGHHFLLSQAVKAFKKRWYSLPQKQHLKWQQLLDPRYAFFEGILWSSTANPKLSTKTGVSCLDLSESVSLKSHPQVERWSHPKAQVHKCEDGSFSCRTISSPQWGGGRIMPPVLRIFREPANPAQITGLSPLWMFFQKFLRKSQI